MKKLFPTCLAIGLLAGAANAAISVGPSPTTYTFDTQPTVAEGWSTLTVSGNNDAFTSASALDSAVIANTSASSITTALGSSGTYPPSQQNIARWNSSQMFIQTRPTGNSYLLLLATLVNDSGADMSGLSVSYDWGQHNSLIQEEIPGHRVFFSLSGTPGTWTLIPEFSNFTMESGAQTVSATLPLGNWPAGSTMYILFVDDNGDGGNTAGSPLEGAYSIDNLTLAPSTANVPLNVTLVSPANSILTAPADVVLTALPNGTVPASSVSFFQNDVLVGTDTSDPYTMNVTGLAAGTYSFYAMAQNASETAYSVTNVVIVRDPYVVYSGGTLFESFDGMGAGTMTPVGWYVGNGVPINDVTISVGDGSSAPSSTVRGWNYGTSVDDVDRSLGTAATGADRNTEVRILNDSGLALNAFNFSFEGEVWRTHSTVDTVENLVTYYSVDNGTNWFTTGFDFTSAVPGQNPAVQLNGHDPANKQTISGTVALAAPVAPGGVLRIRWENNNEDGTDGALAINNFTFERSTIQLVEITAPSEGAEFVQGVQITVAANAVMNNPVTAVEFFRDGVLIGSDSTAPFSVVYSNATLGGHTLTATARDNSGATMSSAGVNITIIPNTPPSVTITNPVAGYETNVGTMIAVGADATDDDGGVARVDFYVNGMLWASDTSRPYAFELVDALAGTINISAVAVDVGNFQSTPSVIQFTVTNPPDVTLIITNGSSWKYLDNGSDQGTAWRASAFNDAAWSTGFAEFGYGDAPGRPERTRVEDNATAGYVSADTNRFITTYFRKKFQVANPSAFSDLQARLLRDDGAVVYINGTEVWRSHMTNGAINYLTLAGPAGAGGAASDDGNSYQSTNISPSVLVAGENTIAVEIHQEGSDSSDISFDFMLWGVAGGATGPRLSIVQTSSTQATISWDANAAGYTLQSNTDLGNSAGWTTVQGPLAGAGSTTVTTSGTLRFYRLRQ